MAEIGETLEIFNIQLLEEDDEIETKNRVMFGQWKWFSGFNAEISFYRPRKYQDFTNYLFQQLFQLKLQINMSVVFAKHIEERQLS